eukprot:757088-Hanusia_phi.AAC.7
MLVQLGADLQAKDYRGETPLQRATVANQSKVVQYIKWMIWSQQEKFSRESDSALVSSRGAGRLATDVRLMYTLPFELSVMISQHHELKA